jgi:hypothetical protein
MKILVLVCTCLILCLAAEKAKGGIKRMSLKNVGEKVDVPEKEAVKEYQRTIFNPDKDNLEEFLKKNPPSTTRYEDTPWIQLVRSDSFDNRTWINGAVGEFNHRVARLKYPKKDKRNNIPRMLTYLAKKYSVKLGKWMLLFDPKDIDEKWNTIARAMYSGFLDASTAKVAPAGHPYGHLICVYTYNFMDLREVMKLRQQLLDLGFEEPLDYKADIYTNTGIYEKNDFDIPENIYRL